MGGRGDSRMVKVSDNGVVNWWKVKNGCCNLQTQPRSSSQADAVQPQKARPIHSPPLLYTVNIPYAHSIAPRLSQPQHTTLIPTSSLNYIAQFTSSNASSNASPNASLNCIALYTNSYKKRRVIKCVYLPYKKVLGYKPCPRKSRVLVPQIRITCTTTVPEAVSYSSHSTSLIKYP